MFPGISILIETVGHEIIIPSHKSHKPDRQSNFPRLTKSMWTLYGCSRRFFNRVESVYHHICQIWHRFDFDLFNFPVENYHLFIFMENFLTSYMILKYWAVTKVMGVLHVIQTFLSNIEILKIHKFCFKLCCKTGYIAHRVSSIRM